MQPLIRLLLALVLVLPLGCGDDDDDNHLGDGDGDVDADGDADAHWMIEDVDTDDAASQTSLAISASGQIGIAYYQINNFTDGTMCPEGDPPGPRFYWRLRFASGTPGAMVVEQVDQPFFVIETRGTTVRYQGETPHIVAMSGEVEPTRLGYCGANDLYLFTKNGAAWTRDLVVRDSGETPADSCMAPSASTYGWVVGMYPGLAISPTGQFAVAWRDIHAGATLQRDDLARSDLEASIGGPGNWPKEMIDCGTAAGDYTTLAWEPSGGLVGAWYTDIRAGAGEQAREGTWVGRRAQPAWEEYRLSQGKSGPRTSMAVAPDGTIGVTWYEDQMLKYAYVAAGRPLSEAVIEIASHIGDNSGMYSSLAYTADSIPVVAHYRCNRYLPNNPGCDNVEDGPVWSWREDGVWDTDDIEPSNDEYKCGDNTQIAVRPDGSIVAVYSCQVYEEETQTFNSTLRLAWRAGL